MGRASTALVSHTTILKAVESASNEAQVDDLSSCNVWGKKLVKRVKNDMIETFMLPTLPTLNSVPNQLRALDGLHGIGLVVLPVSMSHILATSTVQYV